jgi:hypothetical protein
MDPKCYSAAWWCIIRFGLCDHLCNPLYLLLMSMIVISTTLCKSQQWFWDCDGLHNGHFEFVINSWVSQWARALELERRRGRGGLVRGTGNRLSGGPWDRWAHLELLLLPIFAKIWLHIFQPHFFMAATLLWLATLWLGKMWLGTKHSLRASPTSAW